MGRALLVAVLTLVALKLFVIDVYTVPQQGMLPGVVPGSRFLGWKRPYRDPSQVKRGDVVVFTRRLDDGKDYQFVWRVVGLPGDRLKIDGDTVRVNGQELAREPVRTDGPLAIYRESNGGVTYEVAYPAHAAGPPPPPSASLTVPPQHFFVLGDNRHHARDSRYDGTVPFTSIVARKR